MYIHYDHILLYNQIFLEKYIFSEIYAVEELCSKTKIDENFIVVLIYLNRKRTYNATVWTGPV